MFFWEEGSILLIIIFLLIGLSFPAIINIPTNYTTIQEGINALYNNDYNNLKKLKIRTVFQEERIIKNFNLKK